MLCGTRTRHLSAIPSFDPSSRETCVEPCGIQVLKNPNLLKDVEVSAMLDVVVLV